MRRRGVAAFVGGSMLVLQLAFGAPASAQLAGRAADEWIATLDSPTRVAAMRIPDIIDALGIEPGQTVADVGAGSGAISGPLAIAAGPTGTMYAVDIDKALLAHIAQRASDLKLANIKTVLGTFTDPTIPAPVDLAFMNDVLHHVDDRPTYLKNLAKYIKPGGRFAIVDYKPEHSPHRAQPELVVSEAQVDEWAKAAGLTKTKSLTLFEDRYYVIYTRP